MSDRLEDVREAVEGFVPGIVVTPLGPVDVSSITVTESCVEVTVRRPAGGDPHFRIFNPPTRPDPISAVAHAVALAGGVCG